MLITPRLAQYSAVCHNYLNRCLKSNVRTWQIRRPTSNGRWYYRHHRDGACLNIFVLSVEAQKGTKAHRDVGWYLGQLLLYRLLITYRMDISYCWLNSFEFTKVIYIYIYICACMCMFVAGCWSLDVMDVAKDYVRISHCITMGQSW